MFSYSGVRITRNSSRNTCPQSSQLAESLWTDPGVKSRIGTSKLLVSTSKQKKNTHVGKESLNLSPKNPSRLREKGHHHQLPAFVLPSTSSKRASTSSPEMPVKAYELSSITAHSSSNIATVFGSSCRLRLLRLHSTPTPSLEPACTEQCSLTQSVVCLAACVKMTRRTWIIMNNNNNKWKFLQRH